MIQINFLVKFPLVSRIFLALKFSRLGEFEPKFPEEILGEEIFPENFLVRNVFFPQEMFDPSNPNISRKNFLVRNGLRNDLTAIKYFGN